MLKIPGEILHPFLHLQAEMENIQRETDIYLFFILRGYSSRNHFFLAEMDETPGEMVHPFLHLQAEMENIYREK
jgi:hypothetical protein